MARSYCLGAKAYRDCVVAVPIVRNGMRVRVESHVLCTHRDLANRLLPSDLENPSQSFTVIVGELCTETFGL